MGWSDRSPPGTLRPLPHSQRSHIFFFVSWFQSQRRRSKHSSPKRSRLVEKSRIHSKTSFFSTVPGHGCGCSLHSLCSEEPSEEISLQLNSSAVALLFLRSRQVLVKTRLPGPQVDWQGPLDHALHPEGRQEVSCLTFPPIQLKYRQRQDDFVRNYCVCSKGCNLR